MRSALLRSSRRGLASKAADLTSKAVRAHGPRDYTCAEPARRALRKGESRIRVEACGICASDLKMFHATPSQEDCFYWGASGRVVSRPVTPGHEFVGTVEQVADGAPVRVGERVAIETQVSCGQCWFCENGMPHKCDDLRIFGQGVDGGMATHAVLPVGSSIHRVPKSVPAHHAAFAEPLSVGLRAVERAQIQDRGEGQLLVVSGCGPIGLAIVAGLRVMAPRATVVVVDRMPSRLQIARECGATLTATADEDLELLIRRLAPQRKGCDVFFEATGFKPSIDCGLQTLRKCGTMIMLGIASTQTAHNWNIISAQKELTVLGSNLGHGMWPLAIRMLAGAGRGRTPWAPRASAHSATWRPLPRPLWRRLAAPPDALGPDCCPAS